MRFTPILTTTTSSRSRNLHDAGLRLAQVALVGRARRYLGVGVDRLLRVGEKALAQVSTKGIGIQLALSRQVAGESQ
jgi:hypothetical protein